MSDTMLDTVDRLEVQHLRDLLAELEVLNLVHSKLHRHLEDASTAVRPMEHVEVAREFSNVLGMMLKVNLEKIEQSLNN